MRLDDLREVIAENIAGLIVGFMLTMLMTWGSAGLVAFNPDGNLVGNPTESELTIVENSPNTPNKSIYTVNILNNRKNGLC